MKIEDMETASPQEEENTYTEVEASEDLAIALDLMQKTLKCLAIIKIKDGRVVQAPKRVPELVVELDEFLSQWKDYGLAAEES